MQMDLEGYSGMDYYLVMPGQPDVFMGTQSFGFFYPDTGFDMLIDLSETKPELIKFIKIITERGIQLTTEDFLRLFEGEDGLKIRRRT